MTKITGDIGSPLYERVADALRNQIFSGELRAGQRLDGEHILAARLEVSRLTLRSALSTLEREGLIVKRQGLGTFVQPQRVRQIIGRLETLNDAIAEQGLASQTSILGFSFGVPGESARIALGLDDEARVLSISRLHAVNGEPIAVVELSIVESLGAQLTRADVAARPLYELLPEKLGITLGRATQSVRAEAADAAPAAKLSVPRGSALLICERVTTTVAGEPIIHALFYYRADRFEFRMTLEGSERQFAWATPGLSRLKPAADPAQGVTP